jgi:T5SS/PEP-CTERM-associated repeat protein
MSDNLVQNDSFEDDGIGSSTLIVPVTDWTFSLPVGAMNAGETSAFDPVLAGSHASYLAIGTKGTVGLVSQVIPTVAGELYLFSFQFSSDGATGNEFQALWNSTVVMDATSAPYNNGGWSNYDGTAQFSFTETAVSSSTTIAFGGMGNGASYVGVDGVFVTPISTWTWLGGIGAADSPANWTLTSGAGNSNGTPQTGDTAIIATGTMLVPLDAQLNSNTLEIGGTAGVTAGGVFTGDALVNYAAPTFDAATVLDLLVPGQTTAESGLLEALGTFVNQGSILADGPTGSSLTIDIAGTTINGTFQPGYYFNPGLIEADAGNTLTINVGASSEVFNASSIIANGGDVLITADPSAIAGGIAAVAGFYVVEAGGTLETEASYPLINGNLPGGSTPRYEFGDNTPGNTLKIDNLGSFGGAVVAFQAGDTVDLGTTLAVGSLVYGANTGLLELVNASGTILDSLFLSANGMVTSGTFAVNSGTADGIIIGTGADGDTVLTTDRTFPEASGISGTWQDTASWNNGTVPGATDTAAIGLNEATKFTLTTGSAPVSVAGISIFDPQASVEITSDTTALPGIANVYTGTLEVTGGNTLTSSSLRTFDTRSSITVDAGGTVEVTGRPGTNLAAISGTLAIVQGNSSAVELAAGTLVVDGALIAGPTKTSNGGNFTIGNDSAGVPASVIVNGDGTSTDGQVTDTYSLLGSDPTSSGTLTLNGADANWTDTIDPADPLNSRGFMLVGYNNLSPNSGTLAQPRPLAAAQVLIENNATLTDQARAYVADSLESAGNVTVTSGGLWDVGFATGGVLEVGYAGSGSLTISAAGTVEVGNTGTFLNNGTTFTSGGVGIGVDALSSGTVTVDGVGSQLTSLGGMGVGDAGSGALIVENGGTVDTSGLGIGQTAGGTGSGTVTVTGNGSALNAGNNGIGVGKLAPGMLDVESGAVVTVGTSGIGAGNSIVSIAGTIIVDGLGSKISTNGGIGLGRVGHGTLEVQNSGSVQLITSNLNLGGTGSGPTGGSAYASVGTGGQIEIGDNLFVWQGSTVAVLDGASGLDVGTSNAAQAGDILVEATHRMYGNGIVNGAVLNNGIITATNNGTFSASTGGTLDVNGAITGTGTLQLAAGSTLKVSGSLGIGQTVLFNAGTETLVLTTPGGGLGNPLDSVSVGDRIEFGGGMTIDTVTMLNANTAEIGFHGSGGLPGTYDVTGVNFTGTASQFGFGHDPATGDAFIQAAPPCFAAGTRIATERGAIAVENLQAGDRVRVALGEAPQPIIWIGHRRIECARHHDPRLVWPVRIRTGAFGPGLPGRDLWLSPDHAVYINEVLIPVKYLINGGSIAQVPTDEVTYYHVELPEHSVLLAEGLAAESYLDTGDRANFSNGGGPIALHPDFSSRIWEAAGCAPLVVTGSALDAARRLVAPRIASAA